MPNATNRCSEGLATLLHCATAGILENAKAKAGMSCIGVALTWLFGQSSNLIWSLLLLTVLDFVLGFIRGWLTNNVSSRKMRIGIAKFILYGIVLIVGVHCGDALVRVIPIFNKFNLRDVLVAYLVVNEGLSVLEHLVHFGIPLPLKLISRLRSYREGAFTGLERRKTVRHDRRMPPTKRGKEK